jgi:LssY C-terminus
MCRIVVPNSTASAAATGFPAARSLFELFATVMLAISLSPVASANCDNIPAGKTFWVRLLDPVASYSSKPGTSIRAILIQSPECGSNPVFPAGLEVDGEVISKHKVGLGFIYNSASLEIQFNRIVTASGSILPIASQVVEIDNARETVRRGVIHGIRATDTPQGRLTSGLIHLPTINPYGDLGLIIYRSLSVLPESEIYLPPSTDLRIQLNVPLYVGDQPEIPRPSFELDEYERGDIEMLLENMPDRTSNSAGKDADLINFLFVGSEEQLHSAFLAAGWLQSDRSSSRAFFKEFSAYLTLSNYSTMPVSKQYLNGQSQEFAWQKSLDSYNKREHLRIWGQPRTVLGLGSWLGAYTRETGAALSPRYHQFIHHIARNLDDGVNMLVRDLTLSGCVDSVRLMARPSIPHLMTNATGDEMRTDGVLTVVHLKTCNRPAMAYTRANPLIPIRPRSSFVRYFRNEVLLYKSDVVRGNILYTVFEVGRMSIRRLRRRHSSDPQDEDDDNLPLSPVSPETLVPQLVSLNGVSIEP